MPTPANLQTVTVRTQGFVGGANIRDAINLLGANEARPLENMVLDERGGAQKRRGCNALLGYFGPPTARVLSMYTFMRGMGVTPQILIHTTEGKLYVTSDPHANPVSWTEIALGLSTTSPMSFETFKKKCYMSNGVDPYCAWDGAAYTTFPSAPRGRFLRLWSERMWISGVTGENDRIYASDENLPEVFTISNWVDIAAGDGDHVRALANDGQFLVVAKRERTWTIYDPVEFFNRLVDPEKGFESHFACTSFEGSLYFLSRRGICQYMGDAPSVMISERIEPAFIEPFIELTQINKATAYTFLNRVGFVVPESGETRNSLVIEYYPKLAGVTQTGTRSIGPFTFHRMPVQCFARWRYGSYDRLYAAHNQAAKMLECFAPVGTDDGVPFQAMLQTAWFDFGNPTHTKYLREMRFLCGGRFDVLIFRDFEEGIYRNLNVDARGIQDDWDISEVWGEDDWGKEDPVRDILRTNIDAYARWFSFRFQDSFETDTNFQTFWIGSRDRDLAVGEWAIYGVVAEASVLGKRS